jgi:hypothetical protein
MIDIRLYSRAQQERAMRLVERADQWAEGRRKSDGLRFNVFASESAPGVYYQTHLNGLGCTCPGAQKSKRGRCFHQLACQIVTERAQAPRPLKTYDEVYGLVDAF